MEDVLAVIGVFGSIPLIVWIVSAYRTRAQKNATEVMKSMVDKGDTLSPEIIRSLGIRPSRPHGDLRTGLILAAIAVATILFGGAIPEEDAGPVLTGLAMFPLLVGLAYIGFWVFISRKSEPV